jgi:hypothetical protein
MIPVMDHSTYTRVVSVDCWFFINSSIIAFIMVRSSFELMHLSSSSPTGGGGGCGGGGCGPCFSGMVNGKPIATQAGYRLVKQNARAKEETHSLKHLSSLL